MERYYTLNPNKTAPMGLLETPILGQEGNAGHNAEYAELIRQAIAASGIEDPQARIMEIYYRGGDIPRELMFDVEPTVEALDVADFTVRRLQRLLDRDPKNPPAADEPEAVPFTEERVDVLCGVLNNTDRESIYYLNPDGLFVNVNDSQLQRPNLTVIRALELSDEGDAVIEILRDGKYDVDSYGYQMELVWQNTEQGERRPILLSERQHYSLGNASDGTFTPIVTVLGQ